MEVDLGFEIPPSPDRFLQSPRFSSSLDPIRGHPRPTSLGSRGRGHRTCAHHTRRRTLPSEYMAAPTLLIRPQRSLCVDLANGPRPDAPERVTPVTPHRAYDSTRTRPGTHHEVDDAARDRAQCRPPMMSRGRCAPTHIRPKSTTAPSASATISHRTDRWAATTTVRRPRRRRVPTGSRGCPPRTARVRPRPVSSAAGRPRSTTPLTTRATRYTPTPASAMARARRNRRKEERDHGQGRDRDERAVLHEGPHHRVETLGQVVHRPEDARFERGELGPSHQHGRQEHHHGRAQDYEVPSRLREGLARRTAAEPV